MVLLKYLCNCWRNHEIPLINCEINFILTWSSYCFLIVDPVANQEPAFLITNGKPFIPVLTLSTNDNAKLLQQLRSGFKRTINWDKYQSKVTIQEWNWYLSYLSDPSFQEVNRHFVLSWK